MNSTRRDLFTAGLAAAAAASLKAQTPGQLTAEQVIDRIKANVGVPWASQTVDNIVLGDPKAPVKGIATTMMATLAVVERAVAAGRNLIISHETPVYMHQDDVKPIEQDSTYLFKKNYCAKENAVVFHFHDHWHRRRPSARTARSPSAPSPPFATSSSAAAARSTSTSRSPRPRAASPGSCLSTWRSSSTDPARWPATSSSTPARPRATWSPASATATGWRS